MDIEALQSAYQIAVNKGYKKSIDDFTDLLSNDDEALGDIHSEVSKLGYKKDVEEFSKLLGVKKKEQIEMSSNDSATVGEDSVPNGAGKITTDKKSRITTSEKSKIVGLGENAVSTANDITQYIEDKEVKPRVNWVTQKERNDKELEEKNFRKEKDKELILNSEYKETELESDVFGNIRDIQNKKLLGETFKDLLPKEDAIPNVKVLNDYSNYLKTSSPDKYRKFEEGKLTKDDSDGYNFFLESLSHQKNLMDAKKENGLLDSDTYNLSIEALQKKFTQASIVHPLELFKVADKIAKENSMKNGAIDPYLYGREYDKAEKDYTTDAFKNAKGEIIKDSDRQKEIDARYNEALENPYNPINAAIIMDANIVSPALSAFTKFGANIMSTSLRLGGLASDATPGIPSDFSDKINDFADDLYKYFDTEKASSIYKQPSRLKGGIIDNGEMQWEKLTPRVSETLANMWALVGGGGYASIPLSGVKSAESIGLVASAFMSSQNEYYLDAVSNGMSNKEAMTYSLTAASTTAMLERISPQSFLNKNIISVGIKDFFKEGGLNATKKNLSFLTKEVGFENLQEGLQLIGDKSNNYLFNKVVGSTLNDEFSSDEIAETVALTTITSGLLSTKGMKTSNKIRQEAFDYAFNNTSSISNLLSSDKTIESIGKDKIEAVKKDVAEYSKIYDNLPKRYSNEQRNALALNALDLKRLEESKKELENLPEEIVSGDKEALDKEIAIVKGEINKNIGKESKDVDKDRETYINSEFDKRQDEVAGDEGMTDVKASLLKEKIGREYDDARTPKPIEVSNAPKGNHLNIGLLEGRTNKVIPIEEVLSKLPKGVEVVSYKEVEGTEPSISLETSRKLTDEEMSKLLDDTQQQAIPQLSDGIGVLHDVKIGTEESWGDFNSDFFQMQDGNNLTESIKGSKLTDLEQKYSKDNKEDKFLNTIGKIRTEIQTNTKGTLSANPVLAAVDTMLAIVETAYKAGKSIKLAIQEAIDTDKKYSKLNDKQKKEVLNRLYESTGNPLTPQEVDKIFNKKSKTSREQVDKNVEGKAKGDKKTINTWTEFKKSLRQQDKDIKKGVAVNKVDVKKLKENFISWVKENAKEINKTDATLSSSILKSVASLTENNTHKVISNIEDRMEKSRIKTAEKTARDIQKKIPKASKKTPKNVKELGKDIKSINPRWVDDVEELISIADEYVKAVNGGGGLGNLPQRVSKLMTKADLNKLDYVEAKIKEEYENSDLNEVLTFNEYKKFINEDVAIESNDEDEDSILQKNKKTDNRIKLEKVVAWRLQEIQDKLDNGDLTIEQKKTLEALLTISDDMDNFTSKELKEVNNVISEIITYDSFNSSGTITKIIEGKNRAKALFSSGIPVEFSKLINGAFEPLMSLLHLTKAMSGSEGGRKLKDALVAKLNVGYNKSESRADIFNKVFTRKFEKLGLTEKGRRKSNFKIGMFSFILQDEVGMTDSEISVDFEAKKMLIGLQLDKIKQLSNDKRISSGKRESLKELYDIQKEIYDEFISKANNKEELSSMLSDKENSLYQFSKDAFFDIEGSLKNSHEVYNGSEFISFENYTPTSQVKVGGNSDLDNDINSVNKGFNNINTKQSGATKKRVKMPTKNADGSINTEATVDNIKTVHLFDFNKVTKQKYKEAQYDVNTLGERKAVNAMINTKEMSEMFGDDLHKKLKNRLADKINIQGGNFLGILAKGNKVENAVYNSINYLKATVLKTADQWIKQPVPIVAHSMVQNGVKTTLTAHKIVAQTMMDDDAKKAFNELIESSEIANRVAEGEFLFKQHKSFVEHIIKMGHLDDNAVVNIYSKYFENALSSADKLATQMSWMAAYMKEAKKNGSISSITSFDIKNHKKDVDAISKADAASQEINNLSDISESAPIMTKQDYRAVRTFLYTFRSFSINMWMHNLIAARDIASGSGLEVNKIKSAKLMAASAASTVMFEVMKEFVVNPGWEGVLNAIGIDDEEGDDDLDERFIEMAKNSAMNYFVGGAPGGEILEGATKAAINWMFELQKEKKEKMPKEEKSSRGERVNKAQKEKENILKQMQREAEKKANKPPFYDRSKALPGAVALPFDVGKDVIENSFAYYEDGSLGRAETYESLEALFMILGHGTLSRGFSKAAGEEKRWDKKTEALLREIERDKENLGRGSGR